MTNRDSALLALRPTVATHPDGELPAEAFQNQVLRPVLKLQNPLLINHFRAYLRAHGVAEKFELMPEVARREYVRTTLQKDVVLRQQLAGMVLGQFTEAEYDAYAADARANQKRLVAMLTQRLQTQG